MFIQNLLQTWSNQRISNIRFEDKTAIYLIRVRKQSADSNKFK